MGHGHLSSSLSLCHYCLCLGTSMGRGWALWSSLVFWCSFDILLCVQLFGDVCYNCSHVIEGDGKASLSLCPPYPRTSCRPSWPSLHTAGRRQGLLRVSASVPHSGVCSQQGLVCELLLLLHLQQQAHPEVSGHCVPLCVGGCLFIGKTGPSRHLSPHFRRMKL